MSNAAQEEVDRLFSQKDRSTAHPEDARENSPPVESDQETSDTYVHSDADVDDDDDEKPHRSHRMSTTTTSTATYHLPTTVFDANTGPKGVIADAQSFDRARKRSFRRTLMNFANVQNFMRSQSPEKPTIAVTSSAENSGSDDDEEFMRQWRQSRLQELSTNGVQQRRASPSKRKYGTLDVVDANGYLDAVEKVPSDTVVVVCIYDPEVS